MLKPFRFLAIFLFAFFILTLHGRVRGIRLEQAPIEPNVSVRILTKYNPRSVRLFSESQKGLTVVLGTEEKQADACGVSLVGEKLGVRCGGTEAEKFRAITVYDVNGPVGVEIKDKVKRRYHGKITIEAGDTELLITNIVPLETYLVSVTAGEMPGTEPEALKAQAVLARTYAIKNRSKHGTFDFTDLTTDQVYGGVEGENKHAAQAVKQTAGEIITYNGEVIKVYYHSTSGGRTTTPDLVWGGETAPYLHAVPDEYCSISPHYRWMSTLTGAQLRQLEVEGLKGTLIDIKVASRTPDGRVGKVEIKLSTGARTMTGYNFYRLVGQTLGWDLVKSDWFSVSREGGRVTIHGRGLGHGVGVSQWGAIGMAKKGKKYKEIITYYFKDVKIEKWEGLRHTLPK